MTHKKKALEWLNAKLAGHNIVVSDISNCFSDGLLLIYALEAASGQSLGKYNKKAMFAVHRLDNITVALSFLAKHGVPTHEFSPQGK
jgi:hypothetical protein